MVAFRPSFDANGRYAAAQPLLALDPSLESEASYNSVFLSLASKFTNFRRSSSDVFEPPTSSCRRLKMCLFEVKDWDEDALFRLMQEVFLLQISFLLFCRAG